METVKEKNDVFVSNVGILKSNEVVKEQWNYAEVDSSKGNVSNCRCSLIVTNQRLIHVQEAKDFFFSDDIQLSHIKGVTTCYKQKKNMAWSIVFAIGLFSLIPIILLCMEGDQSEANFLFVVPIVMVIISLFMAIFIKPKAFLSINVKSNTEDHIGMEVKVGSTIVATGKTKKADRNIVAVHGEVAEDIAKRLGGLL